MIGNKPTAQSWEAEKAQQFTCFIVSLRGGGHDNIEPAHLIDLVVADFREHDLFLETHCIVTATVEALGVQPTKIPDAGHCNGDQAVQKFIHAFTAQGNLATDRHAFTQLELRDRLLGLGDNGLLARNQFHFVGRNSDLLAVLRAFANAHVERDLFDLGNFHMVLIAEFRGHRGCDFGVILRLKTRNVLLSHQSSPRT